ncbi:MAG: VWA domain-containing protein [Pseudomonadota bacterium]
MSSKDLRKTNDSNNVDSFLQNVASAPPVKRSGSQGRLLFAMDATASREPSWELARSLQASMFNEVSRIGGLDVQLVYFRGYAECRASPWVNDADTLHRFMKSVRCEAGTTQIERVLTHAIKEAQANAGKQPVGAMVYVGDCLEESIDVLGKKAGELRLLNVPVFFFQEGYEPVATRGFAQLAKVSGGAHCRFDSASAAQLGALLRAVAVYASGGKAALDDLKLSNDSQVRALLEQIKA